MSLCLSTAFADYFPTPSHTPMVCDYLGDITINGQPADPNDEIAFLDSQGNVCGHFVVTKTGKYGFLHVFATANERFSVRVWDASSNTLYQDFQIHLTPGELPGTALPSSVPPIFQQNARFVLHISAHDPLLDINMDGILNMADIIALLQFLSK